MNSKVRQQIARYCAYQERSHQDVRNKLVRLGVKEGEVEALIAELIEQDFINEERFARAYASGKFRYNGWGRLRIERMLVSKEVSAYCIRVALEEIPEADYRRRLDELITAYLHKHRSMDEFHLRQRTARYLMTKGYEGDLVWDRINALRHEG